ncbi:hypothetical protein Micbo1qcDRAFT_211855 [Microdochium bolleyi]|uniref:Uncharacterized protein n=1 Tax=Microdochium bolleyi TaxID=196109 RepID=A0A136JKD2_9PEZI|nr:hypothetical protein Micbo1qcDRAFT_211855 [Microdochium bolleyi]
MGQMIAPRAAWAPSLRRMCLAHASSRRSDSNMEMVSLAVFDLLVPQDELTALCSGDDGQESSCLLSPNGTSGCCRGQPSTGPSLDAGREWAEPLECRDHGRRRRRVLQQRALSQRAAEWDMVADRAARLSDRSRSTNDVSDGPCECFEAT